MSEGQRSGHLSGMGSELSKPRGPAPEEAGSAGHGNADAADQPLQIWGSKMDDILIGIGADRTKYCYQVEKSYCQIGLIRMYILRTKLLHRYLACDYRGRWDQKSLPFRWHEPDRNGPSDQNRPCLQQIHFQGQSAMKPEQLFFQSSNKSNTCWGVEDNCRLELPSRYSNHKSLNSERD